MENLHRGSGSSAMPRPTGGCGTELRAATLAAGIVLSLAGGGGAAAQEAAESTAITDLYTSLLSGVGKSASKDASKQAVGWAMSAIGLSGGDSGQLAAISAELQQIDADLKAINSTLAQINDAIRDETCAEVQTGSVLQSAIQGINQSYNQYETWICNVNDCDGAGTAYPGADEVEDWMNGVIANFPGYLDAIDTAVYATPGGASVIDACALSTAEDWRTNNAEPTAATLVDDRPSYAALTNIVNYYYGLMTQGTTVLVEAYHLQACQDAAASDPDLHCDFEIPSTSTAPSSAAEICQTSDPSEACVEAVEAVTFPSQRLGLYERVEDWLMAAGAPYATGEAVDDDPRQFVTGELALLSSLDGSSPQSWDPSYAYLLPKDLLDFTNNATLNGEIMVHCASPLTSKNPCGPVGPYNANFDAAMVYAGYDNWNAISAEVMLLLLKPYNDKQSGGFDASGLVSDYLYSIGFSEAAKSSGLIITSDQTGKNGDTGFEAICFMDTAAPRDKAKQPWCDGISGEVQGTDNLIDTSHNPWVESGYLNSIGSQPLFYELEINLTNGKVEIAPGWFVAVQQEASTSSEKALYWQFHWPIVDVSKISCQSGKPYTNPGGLLSRCGDDLQAYVDALLPPPGSDTTALAASGDATVTRAEPNANHGDHPQLAVGSRAGSDIVVQFEDERIRRFVDGGELTSAILRLSPAERSSPRRLDLLPVYGGFVEGNGLATGATWNCAEDADVTDNLEECLEEWPRGGFGRPEARWPDYRDRRLKLLGWDVTEDVRDGVYAWRIRLPSRHARTWRPQRHRGGFEAREAVFHSREGAAELRQPVRAPTLLLERDPADDVLMRAAISALQVGVAAEDSRASAGAASMMLERAER